MAHVLIVPTEKLFIEGKEREPGVPVSLDREIASRYIDPPKVVYFADFNESEFRKRVLLSQGKGVKTSDEPTTDKRSGGRAPNKA